MYNLQDLGPGLQNSVQGSLSKSIANFICKKAIELGQLSLLVLFFIHLYLFDPASSRERQFSF